MRLMNKKYAMVGVSVLVGGAMMCATALASTSGGNGYDVYKTALKTTLAAGSATTTVGVTVADNGKTVLNLNDIAKMSQSSKNMSSSLSVTTGGQTKTNDVYRQDSQTVTKSSDSSVYNVMQAPTQTGKPETGIQRGRQNLAMTSDVERIVDLASASFQNYISLNNQSDGTKAVSLKMSGSQISPLENAIASLFVKSGTKESTRMDAGMGTDSLQQAVRNALPKLVNNISVQDVNLLGVVTDKNLIQDQKAEITVTGDDASGTTHTVVISVDMHLTNIGSTTPDKVDLTGKQVKTIERHTFQKNDGAVEKLQ